jgi:hypothetical protein
VIEALRCLEGGAPLKIYVELNSCASTTTTTITVGRSASTSAQSDAHRALFAAWRAGREELLKGRPVPPTVPRRLALPAGPPIKVRLPLHARHTRTAQTAHTERTQQSLVQCRSATRGALESVASARTQQSLVQCRSATRGALESVASARTQHSLVQCRSATRGALESVASARTQQFLQFLCVSPRSLVSR